MTGKTMEKKTTETASSRGKRLKMTGHVTSDKMDKTATVKVERRVRHPEFGKIVRRYTTCKVHDEKNEAREGDVVEIIETRPVSATKRWRLVRIVRAAAGAHDEPAEAAKEKA